MLISWVTRSRSAGVILLDFLLLRFGFTTSAARLSGDFEALPPAPNCPLDLRGCFDSSQPSHIRAASSSYLISILTHSYNNCKLFIGARTTAEDLRIARDDPSLRLRLPGIKKSARLKARRSIHKKRTRNLVPNNKLPHPKFLSKKYRMFEYHQKLHHSQSNFIDTSPRFLLYHKNHRFFSRLCELFVNFKENKTAHHTMSGH